MNFTCISHVFNEEDLIGYWLVNHLPLFDRFIFIDHQCTDKTLDIIKAMCPKAIIIPSKLESFDAALNDQEVMEVERAFYEPPQATFVLNTTEFIWATNFREKVINHLTAPNTAIGVGSIIMVDKEPQPWVEYPLFEHRTHGFVDTYPGIRRKRYFHNASCGEYHFGRHGTSIPAKDVDDIYLLYLAFCPWPKVASRKLQVQTRIPMHNKQAGLGIEHLVTPEALEARYQDYLSRSGDLLSVPQFAEPRANTLAFLKSEEAFELHTSWLRYLLGSVLH